MNFLWWIRSEINFPAAPNAGVHEIQSRVIRALEKKVQPVLIPTAAVFDS